MSPEFEETLAEKFHETYERLAPHYDYKTRVASAVPWADVPDTNKALMVGVICDLLRRDAIADPAEVERLRRERRDFTTRLGFGDGVTEPQATLAEMVDPIQAAFSDAGELFERPLLCELCGEWLASDECPQCRGSGCLPNPQLAYLECDLCAGVGRLHTGCVERSYADLIAERDAALAEVERLTDTEKVQGAMIRELERLNTELNDELGTAVQMLKLERDGLRERLAAVEAVAADHMTGPISGTVTDWVPLDELLAALAEPTPSGLPTTSKLEVVEHDPQPRCQICGGPHHEDGEYR